MSPTLRPEALIQSVAETVYSRDPAGEASPVFDLGTGKSLSARVKLWDDAELRFWVKERKLLGDQVFCQLTGQIDPLMASDSAPVALDGAQNVPELAIAILSQTAALIFHQVIIEAPHSDEVPAEQAESLDATLRLFLRGRKIRKQLELIAKEKHEGRYKMQAFTSAVLLSSSQKLAELALHVDTGDFNDDDDED